MTFYNTLIIVTRQFSGLATPRELNPCHYVHWQRALWVQILINFIGMVWMKLYLVTEIYEYNVQKWHNNLVQCNQVSHIGCGYGFTLAADTSSSRIWTTGLNTFGQLGRHLTCNNLKGDISQLFFFFFLQASNYPVMYKLVLKNVKQ